MTSRSSNQHTLLLDLVAEGLARIERGETVDVEQLCEQHPSLALDVADALGLADHLFELGEVGKRGDPLFGALVDGRYRLYESVGAGAMGVVYRAEDRELGRQVAVKVMRSDAIGPEEVEERFLREAAALAAIRHPGIVAVHDRGRVPDGRPYLVMEFVDGRPLQELEEQQPVRTVAQWIAELAEGLEAAHAAGIYHRDVKPSNVLVREDGSPVLVDFGVAAGDAKSTLTQGVRGVGTPAYMAPEQLEIGVRPGPSVDVYGLAATLYHLLTSRPPYEGTPSQVLANIGRRDPIPAERLRSGLPRDLLAILGKGLARRPEDRYASVANLREDLEAFLAHAPVRARYVGPVGRTWRRARRSVAVRTAVGVLVVVGLVAGVRSGWLARVAVVEAAHRRVYAEESAQLEPMLTLFQFEDREFTDPDARRRVEQRLDRMVEFAEEPVHARALRSAFRFDHGDRSGSVADLRAIATLDGSAVATALADATAGAEGTDARAIDITALPEPASGTDSFLMAFHAFRVRDMQRLDEALLDPRVDGYGPADELRILRKLMVASRLDDAGLAGDAHAEAIRLEERRGRPTAITGHLIGAALLELGRYEDAEQVLRAALDFSPRSGNLLGNLAIALRRRGKLEDAIECSRSATELRPHSASWFLTLFWSCVELEWFGVDGGPAQALELLEGETPFTEAEKADLRGGLELELAMIALYRGDFPVAKERAKEAVGHWRSTAGVTVDPFKGHVAIQLANGQRPFTGVLELLDDESDSWWHLLRILALMPESLDTEQAAALEDALHRLIKAMNPEIHLLNR